MPQALSQKKEINMKKNEINYTQFVIICIISFAFFLSNQMVVNTVTKYADTMSATSQMLGLIGGAYGLFALLTRPLSGQIVDRERHKPVLLAGIGLLLLSNVILIWAEEPVMVLLSRAVNGLAFGIVSTLCMTTACNALPKNKMANGIGIYTLSQTIAQVIGPAIAIRIIEIGSFLQLYMCTTLIMGCAMILSLGFKSDHKPNREVKYSFNLKKMFTVNAFLPGSVLMCNVMEIAAVSSYLLLYADSIGVGGLSFFFTIQAISILVTRPFISKILNEKNIYGVTLISELMLVVGLLNLFFAKTTGMFLISAVLFGLGKSGYQPCLTGMCVSSVPESERGRASNTSYAFNDIGQFLGSYVASFVVGIWGYRYAFLFIACVIAVGTVVFTVAYVFPHVREEVQGN